MDSLLSLGVNYNSIAQKVRIFTIKAPFYPENSFSTNSKDDRIKIKAEITSFNMRYYKNLIKLSLRLRVATIKKASFARLRQLKIGRKSCFGKYPNYSNKSGNCSERNFGQFSKKNNEFF